MQHEEELAAAEQKVSDRRKFLKSAGFTGLGLAGAGILAGRMGAFENTPVAKALGMKSTGVLAAENADIDLAVLNFALNLEYLEAEYYTVATTGKYIADFGIGTTGTGTEGPTTGGKMIDFNGGGVSAIGAKRHKELAEEFTFDEQAHVKLLRSALGNNAVAKPAINLDALGKGFYSFSSFLVVARALEDTGMSAYNGAAPLLTSKDYLAAAAAIALTEANHSGAVRLLVAINGLKTGKLDSQDVLPPPSGSQYFNVTTPNALAVSRNTDQVLAIVYGNSAKGTSKGGFYPNGMNGAIKTIMG